MIYKPSYFLIWILFEESQISMHIADQQINYNYFLILKICFSNQKEKSKSIYKCESYFPP